MLQEKCPPTLSPQCYCHRLPLELYNEMILFASCNSLTKLAKFASVAPGDGYSESIAFLAEKQLAKIRVGTADRQLRMRHELLHDPEFVEYHPGYAATLSKDLLFILPIIIHHKEDGQGNVRYSFPANLALITNNIVLLVEKSFSEQRQCTDYTIHDQLHCNNFPNCSVDKARRQIKFRASVSRGNTTAVITSQCEPDFHEAIAAMDAKTCGFRMYLADGQPPSEDNTGGWGQWTRANYGSFVALLFGALPAFLYCNITFPFAWASAIEQFGGENAE